MSEKIYIGTAKEKIFDDGGSIIDIMLSLDGMKEHFEKYGFITDKGMHKIKLILSKRREPDQYGNTHYVTLNTWKPESVETPSENFEDDIPF